MPIHIAAQNGNWEGVKLLVDARSKDGYDKFCENTALSLALDNEADKVI